MSVLAQAAVFLGAAVVAVPISKRLGLGSVLGYLAAGAVIGPWGLKLIRDVDSILHFAELGVVLLLFIIGLELQPNRLWVMRKSVFGYGGFQVGVSALAIGGIGAFFGWPWQTAVIAGLALALSSTAFALQILAERSELTTRYGRTAFSILLFQDLAAIPLIAIVPVLGADIADELDRSLLFEMLAVVGVLAAVIIVGHFLLRHVLRIVAWTRIREVFTAMTLLTVIGTALIVYQVGLSMALGAFIAGVLLAESEYRHELEANIEPFKGLLLGLFFIAVGMYIDFGLAAEKPLTILAVALGLTALKFAILFGLGKWVGLNSEGARHLAISISQGGEFAFVVFALAVQTGVIDRDLVSLLVLGVIVSMILTPLLYLFDDKVLRKTAEAADPGDYEIPDGEENQVIIAGFGRFGQIIARILRAKHIGFTALEISQQQVDFVKKYGNKVYYGDPARLDLLHAAKADKAVIFVLAVDDVKDSLATAETVRRHFPHLKIFARARDRRHALKLMEAGAHVVIRETYLSSLDVARGVLEELGLDDYQAEKAIKMFRAHDESRLASHLGEDHDEARLIDAAKQAAAELEEIFAEDAEAERKQGSVVD